MPAHTKYGDLDSAPLNEVHAQWNGGVNTVLPADRLPALNFTHALNMEIRKGYPETRRSVERAAWLYQGGTEKLGTTFQGCGLLQGTETSRVERMPSALLVAVDNALWLCAPNNLPLRLLAAATDQTQPVEIINHAGEHAILRGIGQPPLRYRYAPGQRPRALPTPRNIAAFAQLPASETGCSASGRLWLKRGKNRIVASDVGEWDYDIAFQDFLVDDGENDEIVRLWPYGEDRIVVLKTRSVHVLDDVSTMDTTADPPVLPRIYRVAAARGCVAPYTVCQRGSALLYLSREGVEVLELSASAVTTQAAMPLSKAADRYFQEVKWTGISGARAAIADNYYLLSVPTVFGDRRRYPYPMVLAPWDVHGDPPGDWFPTTVNEDTEQCSLTDPKVTAPDPLTGTLLETLAQHDRYGQLGMAAVYSMPRAAADWWNLCAHMAWCDGPEVEAIPLVTEYERYGVRWRAVCSSGKFFYARSGQPLGAAPVELFPEAEDLTGCSEVSLCFDANARPCFATVVAGTIQIRRFVAGTPTTYAFAGSSPRLFFNGLLQPDNTIRDVVCLYLRGRQLRLRVQRDNFATEYTIANPTQPSGAYHLARLGHTDAVGSTQCLGAVTTAGTPLLLRSGLYPLWPVVEVDSGTATVTIGDDGACTEIVLTRSESDVLGTASVTLNADGACEEMILTLSESDVLGTASVTLGADGACEEMIVDGGTYPEPVGAAITLGADGACEETIVDGGTYPEPVGAAIALGSDGACEEE